jgi:glycosyltransferase involved in cell wall biosynthesis
MTQKEPHVVFLFNRSVNFPPETGHIKDLYISRELLSRGIRVTWMRIGRKSEVVYREGIAFVSLGIPGSGAMRGLLTLMHIGRYCRSMNIGCAYADGWLFFRGKPLKILAMQIILKLFRVKFVFDQRDPYIDFQIANDLLREGGLEHLILKFQYRLIYRISDLVILPSSLYADALVEDGAPKDKLIGAFRGIDAATFNTAVDGRSVKTSLNLDGKFVIGFFAMMHRYRQIQEVLIPLIKSIKTLIPNAHILIGGSGPLEREFHYLRVQNPTAPFTYVGFVKYADLPRYLAACDVLLCPIDTRFRLTRNTALLKIPEAIAVGRPIVATRTKLSEKDYIDLKGVIWADSGLHNFLRALVRIYADYHSYASIAVEQANSFNKYSASQTIPDIVDTILTRLFPAF